MRETDNCPLANVNKFLAGWVENWPGSEEFYIGYVRDISFRSIATKNVVSLPATLNMICSGSHSTWILKLGVQVSSGLRHFQPQKTTSPWLPHLSVKNECCCLRIVNLSNVTFTNKYMYHVYLYHQNLHSKHKLESVLSHCPGSSNGRTFDMGLGFMCPGSEVIFFCHKIFDCFSMRSICQSKLTADRLPTPT